MKITPLFDRVLLEPTKEEKKSNIILPENAEKSIALKVSATGKECKTVQINDLVLINQFAGSEFNINGKNYILIKECDILAVVKGE